MKRLGRQKRAEREDCGPEAAAERRRRAAAIRKRIRSDKNLSRKVFYFVIHTGKKMPIHAWNCRRSNFPPGALKNVKWTNLHFGRFNK